MSEAPRPPRPKTNLHARKLQRSKKALAKRMALNPKRRTLPAMPSPSREILSASWPTTITDEEINPQPWRSWRWAGIHVGVHEEPYQIKYVEDDQTSTLLRRVG